MSQMNRQETEYSEPLVHAESLSTLERETASEFGAMVDGLLRDAPNVAVQGRYAHDKPSINKGIEFEFGNSTVKASFFESFGSPPAYRLEIITPIIVDNLQHDSNSRLGLSPLNPHEFVEFRGDPQAGSVSVRVRAVDQLDHSGNEMTLTRYTAGGLLPPINTLGEGKIEAFESVIKLFKNVVPQNPVYRKRF